ncbi:carbohydrate kinase of FGGY family protein [Dyadobacter jejuensis]|uniref:Carbohydrate kinase of FGGY family protein n=1 Tax=Dyadobacter jejuensis TaxID=1082580 RepID=A0A316AJY2_9BACT|nr:FGGY-family carbohydrate kinase [Dyadobacter jejuensis]PWJ57832.1 carbohydrate kinase of FGGY family protein [Dyadobacter jejuensis]
MERRASIEGMIFGTTQNHIVWAALESIPYQIKEVIEAMCQDIDADLKGISVNGGLTKNGFVIRFLVDLLGLTLKKLENPDISALGAAYLSGLESGVLRSIDQIKQLNAQKTSVIVPDMANDVVAKRYAGWLERICWFTKISLK